MSPVSRVENIRCSTETPCFGAGLNGFKMVTGFLAFYLLSRPLILGYVVDGGKMLQNIDLKIYPTWMSQEASRLFVNGL